MAVAIIQCKSKSKFPFNIASLLIMKYQESDYSHYAIRFNEGYYHSSIHGVVALSKSQFHKKYQIIRGFDCTKIIPAHDYLHWFQKHCGKRYGFFQVLGLLGKVLNIFKHNPFGKGVKRIICNELIVLFLNRFYATKVRDTDGLDLNDTEDLIAKVRL